MEFVVLAVAASVTIITVASLRFARTVLQKEVERDRCAHLTKWSVNGASRTDRCLLPREHWGPHKSAHPVTGKDHWWQA